MLKGKINKESGRRSIYGWALDDNSENPISIILKIDDTELHADSNIFKQKIYDKYGHGNHAYKIEVPSNFKDSKKHLITLIDKKTKQVLDQKEIVCGKHYNYELIEKQKDITIKLKDYPVLSTYKVQNADGFESTEASILYRSSIDYIPKVSVIVPVYNTSKYLDMCVNSILKQSLSDIEIIFVDDGSTDDSLLKLLEYAQKDHRITVVSQHNNYAGTARNSGITLAKGKYLSFLDSDDFFDFELLKEAYNVCETEQSDVLCFQFYKYDSQQQKVVDDKKYGISLPFNGKNIQSYKPSDENIRTKIFSSTNPAPWNKLYRKSLVDKFCLRFHSIKASNDLFFTYSNIFLSEKITYLFKALAYYRTNTSDNLTNSGERGLDFNTAYTYLRNNLIKHGMEKYLSSFYQVYISSTCWEYDNSKKNKNEIYNILKNDLIHNYYRDYMKTLPSHIANRVRKILGVKMTIIICSYNHEDYIRECLDSVVSQTLNDIEIICVNDGSTDNTLSIMREYEKKDERIIVIDQKNSGPSTGRNKALQIASGEYVQFLDSDDYIRKDTCEMLYKKLKALDLDILFFSGYNFDSQTKEITENQYWSFSYLPENFDKEFFSIKDCTSFVHRMAVSACLSVYKLDFIKINKITFPDGLLFEDNLFFVSSIIKAQRVSILRDKLYYRRVHNKSITQNWESNYSDYLNIVSKVLTLLKPLPYKQCINNYVRNYLSTCITRFNSFSEESKDKYYKKLKSLLDAHNFSDAKIEYNSTNAKCSSNELLISKLQNDLQKYIQARVDIRFLSKTNLNNSMEEAIAQFELDDSKANISTPAWCNCDKVKGYIVTSVKGEMVINFKCSGKGKLVIHLRGVDFTIGNKKKVRLPIYIDYHSFKVNGNELIKNNSKVVDHDHPFEYSENIDGSKEYSLFFKWFPISRKSTPNDENC